MIFFKFMMVFMTIIVYARSLPVNSTWPSPAAPKGRFLPKIRPGVYSSDQIEQIEQAHLDAIMLAFNVVASKNWPNSFAQIFRSYFSISDAVGVIDVFKQIIGPDNYLGSDALANVEFVADYPHEIDGKLTCSKDLAELRDHDTDHPKIILCPDVFRFGSIKGRNWPGDSWPGVPPLSCDTVYPRISYKMLTLGHIRLHEYTHWDSLISPATKTPFGVDTIEDIQYGPYKVRYISEPEALQNADSYAWLATEMFWRRECEGDHGAFGDPGSSDNSASNSADGNFRM